MSKKREWILKGVFLILPFLLFYALLLAFGGSYLEARRLAKNTITHKWPNYTVIVDKDRNIPNLKDRLDWFRTSFHNRFHDLLQLEDLGRQKLTIYIFKSKEQMIEDMWTTTLEDFPQNDGFYDPQRRRLAIIADGPIASDEQSLYHELSHAILDLGAPGDPGWSPWFNEGLAKFSERSFFPHQLGGRDSAAVEIVKRMIEGRWTRPFISLKELLESGQGRFTEKDNTAYYAEAHVLICFLMESPKYAERFPEYAREERKAGPVSLQAFERIFGPLAQAEQDFKSYVERLD